MGRAGEIMGSGEQAATHSREPESPGKGRQRRNLTNALLPLLFSKSSRLPWLPAIKLCSFNPFLCPPESLASISAISPQPELALELLRNLKSLGLGSFLETF